MGNRKAPIQRTGAASSSGSARWPWRALFLLAVFLCLNSARDAVFTQESPSNVRRDDLLGRGGVSRGGMSRADARQRARSMSPSELQRARALARENSTLPPAPGPGEPVTPAQSPPDEEAIVVAEPVPQETEQRFLSAFERQLELYSDPLVDRPVVQFGYDVFERLERTPTDTPVGSDYVLGAGDQLIVSLWGSIDIDQDFEVEIDRSGNARLPMVGPIALKGLPLGRAESLLKRRFDNFYQGYELQVRVARVRDIPVHVTGRVHEPGRVRVPSIATLFDALATAGGVTKDGSLRRVRLRRQGDEDRVLDLYAYLLDGDISVDVSLQANDVIVVPAVGPRVAIVGRVLRPAIYEQTQTETAFPGLLAMAGDYARLANRAEIQLERTSNSGLSMERFELADESVDTIKLRDGDVVVVRSASPRLENVVYLRGNVSMPGRYALQEGMRVADIVTEDALVTAGFWLERTPPQEPPRESARESEKSEVEQKDLTVEETEDEAELRALLEEEDRKERIAAELPDLPEPFLEYALISRIDPRTKQESRLTFHLGRAILDKDPTENHVLQPQDTIVIFPRRDFAARRWINVNGAVEKPDAYEYFPGMRILDLIRVAGGLLPEAQLSSATLTRIHPQQDGTRYEHMVVDLNEVLAGSEAANLELRDNDSLTVKLVPGFKKAYRVTLVGELRHPGVYSVIPGERMSDLLRRAGGFTNEAYLPAASFHRDSVRRLQQERLDDSLRRLELEAKINSQRFAAEASVLQDEKQEVLAEQSRIERLVETIRGVKAKGRMVIRLREPERLARTADDVELMDGDRLEIPRKPEEVHVMGAVFNQNALLYREGMRANDYLQECGGTTSTANVEAAFIIRADGSADSVASARKNYHWDMERGRYSKGSLLASQLYPGDTLVVPHDVEPQLSRLGLTRTIVQIIFQVAMTTGIIVAVA